MSPIIDENFLRRLPSESFAQGLVADVAILVGSNTDEASVSIKNPSPHSNCIAGHSIFLGPSRHLEQR